MAGIVAGVADVAGPVLSSVLPEVGSALGLGGGGAAGGGGGLGGLVSGLLGDVMGPIKGLLGGNQGPACNTQVNMFPFSPSNFNPNSFNFPFPDIFPQFPPSFPGLGPGGPGGTAGGPGPGGTGGVTDQFSQLENAMQSAAASGDPYKMMQAQQNLQNWEQGINLMSSMYNEQHKMIDQMIQSIGQG